MSRPAEIVLVCEDQQQETFVRRFLKRYLGYEARELSRRLRVEKAQAGRGAADQHVLERFPREVAAYRRQAAKRQTRLLVMIDGDRIGVEGRKHRFDGACREKKIEPRKDTEQIVVLVPTWNIETWLHWLGGHDVDETRKDCPKLPKPSCCQPHVDALVAMCQRGELRDPAPPSLVAACSEFNQRYG